MTSDVMALFIQQRPFVPFTMILPNGGEVHVPHSDFIVAGLALLGVNVILPTGQLEVFDTDSVVSIRTFHSAELPST